MTPTSHSTPQPGDGLRGLWATLNAPKRIDGSSMQLACAIFLVAYAVVAIVRYEEYQQAFFWLRLVVCAYAAFGIWVGGHATWMRARVYTVGLAFLLPLQAGYVDGMLGNHVGEVALTALATFIPLVFLQAGWDVVIVDIGLVIGHALVLAIVPTPALSLPALGVLIGGALATGTVAGLQSLTYRARWTESVDQLEDALATSAEWQNRYEAASLTSGQILYDWNLHTNTVTYGGAYTPILGYTLAELSDNPAGWSHVVHPDDREAFGIEKSRAMEARAPFHLQYRVVRKDGRQLFVDDSGHFAYDEAGKFLRLVGFVSDVTERAHAEAARNEEAAISAALARVGRELISSLDTPVVMERLCRLTSEVLGCDFSHTWLWNGEDQTYTPIAYYGVPAEQWEALRVLRVPTESLSNLVAILARDEIAEVAAGTTDLPVVADLMAYYGVSRLLSMGVQRGGEVFGIHVAGRWTRTEPFSTEQSRIARGIAQLASMAFTNAQLVEELERASRLKSEFVSTMSHELRTPLNVIIGYTDMLRDEVVTPEATAHLKRVRESSLELLEMIETTLDLGRLAGGKDLPQVEPIALAELWDELETEFSALPSRPGVALRWEPVAIATLETDRRKLKMILKNLVGNALKFTPAGEVVVRCDRRDATAAITVRDTGIGMSPEHLPHIFEMFRQVDSSDRRSYSGAGLGLYIVHQMVQQLGAKISVTSEPGRGSTFLVLLPVTELTEIAGVAA